MFPIAAPIEPNLSRLSPTKILDLWWGSERPSTPSKNRSLPLETRDRAEGFATFLERVPLGKLNPPFRAFVGHREGREIPLFLPF